MDTFFCSACGAQVPPETKFCTECGAKVEAKQPAYAAAAAPTPQAAPAAQPQYQQAPPMQYQPQLSPMPAAPQQQYAPPAAAVPAASAKPLGVVGYLLTMLALGLPILGIVLGFVWALGKKTNQNRKSFATAYLILCGIGFIGTLVWFFMNYDALMALFKVLMQ